MDEIKIEGKYTAFDIKKEEIGLFLSKAKKEGFLGFNVTLPHKQNIIPFLDEISESSKSLRAVNTVLIKKNKAYGYNTDTYGFMENLNRTFPRWKKRRGLVAVIGAGGAARAAVWSLLKENFQNINVINRSKQRALALIKDMNKLFPKASLSFFDEYPEAIEGAVLLINSTSLGMQGQPPLNIKLQKLRREAIVYDLVYKPLETNLIREAKKFNFSVLDGLGMLLHQAAPAFKIWHGEEVSPNEKLRNRIIENF